MQNYGDDAGDQTKQAKMKVSESGNLGECVAKGTFGLRESFLCFGYVSSISYLHSGVFKG
jgi:hypothetical protein